MDVIIIATIFTLFTRQVLALIIACNHQQFFLRNRIATALPLHEGGGGVFCLVLHSYYNKPQVLDSIKKQHSVNFLHSIHHFNALTLFIVFIVKILFICDT